MRAVVQRVARAEVTVEGPGARREIGRIGRGLLVLLGVERDDGSGDVQYIAGKIRDLRIFEDPADPAKHLDVSVQNAGGSVLLVSEFTLAADCRKGRRPSFDRAAAPPVARPLVDDVVRELRRSGLTVETGEFQATMAVSLVNEGPVTLLLDSRRTF